MYRRIQTREVSSAEDSRLGTSHVWPQDSIHLTDGISLCQSIVQRRHEAIDTNTIGYKVWCILTQHNTLAKHLCCELLHKLHQSGVGIHIGNQLQQLHVAYRIKEMGD